MSVLSEIQIATAARNAIEHGINSTGHIIAAGGTPVHGGSSSSEDFWVYSRAPGEDAITGASINVYVPQIDTKGGFDIKDMIDSFEKPFVSIMVDGYPAQMSVFADEIMACTITWLFALSDNAGLVKDNGTEYRNERACMILRNKLYSVVKNLVFDDIDVFTRGDVEPMSIGKPDPNDASTFMSGVSLFIEYVPEIT